jgi:CDP-diacylglycerol--glycerol-3-phosphate 3-phosphatidyltransferase
MEKLKGLVAWIQVHLRRHFHPNVLTLSRVVLFGPLVCLALLTGHPGWAIWANGCGEFTDLVDGSYAGWVRKRTGVGGILDPMCDSIYHMGIWIVLVSLGVAPLYAVLLFMARDNVVAGVRMVFAKNEIMFRARIAGKLKAFSQAVAQFAIMGACCLWGNNFSNSAPAWLVLTAVVVTTWSGIDYVRCLHQKVRTGEVVFE